MSSIDEEERESLLDGNESKTTPDKEESRGCLARRKVSRKESTQDGKNGKMNGVRLLLLAIANALYLYLGGVVFYALENTPTPTVDIKHQMTILLQTIKETSGDTSPGLQLQSTQAFINSLNKTQMTSLSKSLSIIHGEWSNSEAEEWSLLSAVFFSSTVVTTIGYGNLSPKTPFGRAFCVLYAIIGMPLTLILLALVGQLLANYINEMCMMVTNNLRKHFYPDYSYQSTKEETVLKAPVWLAVLILCCFISLDAALFVSLENWSFGNSLYFVFITFTTIGFGDMVPSNPKAVIFNVAFLYVGLAIVSITLNLLTANIAQQVQEHRDKFNVVKNIGDILKEKGVGLHLRRPGQSSDKETEQ